MLLCKWKNEYTCIYNLWTLFRYKIPEIFSKLSLKMNCAISWIWNWFAGLALQVWLFLVYFWYKTFCTLAAQFHILSQKTNYKEFSLQIILGKVLWSYNYFFLMKIDLIIKSFTFFDWNPGNYFHCFPK